MFFKETLLKQQGPFFFRPESAVSVIPASVSPFLEAVCKSNWLCPHEIRERKKLRGRRQKRASDKLSGLHGGISHGNGGREISAEQAVERDNIHLMTDLKLPADFSALL